MLYTDKKYWVVFAALFSLVFLFGYNLARADSLKAFWDLDDENDSSGNGFNLTNNGGVTFTSALVGNGADYGVNRDRYLAILNNLGIDGGPITMALWIKPSGPDLVLPTAFLTQSSATSKVEYQISINAGATSSAPVIFTRTKQGISAATISSGEAAIDGLESDIWYHLALTYDGVDLKGYFNGNLVDSVGASGSGTDGGTPNATAIAGVYTPGERKTTGLVDEVKIYDYALTDEEIAALAGGPAPETYISLLNPSEAAQYNADTFNEFGVAWERATSSYAQTGFQFRVATSTGNLDNCPAFNGSVGYQSGCWYTSGIYPTGTTTEQQVESFGWYQLLASSTYFGRALMYGADAGADDYSDFYFLDSDGDVSFEVNSEDHLYESYFPDPGTASTTDPDFGILGNAFKNVLKWLFVPPQSTFDLFGGLGDLIKTKPPIGYLTLVSNSILSIDETETGAYELADIGDLSLFQQIRDVFNILIWVGFGGFVFKRIKNLNL